MNNKAQHKARDAPVAARQKGGCNDTADNKP